MRKIALKHRVTFREGSYPGNYDVILTEVSKVGQLILFPNGWSYYPDAAASVTEGKSLAHAKRVAEMHTNSQF